MILPFKSKLSGTGKIGFHSNGTGTIIFCSGVFGLNPNPRVYKYYWQVLTMDSEYEGDEFFEKSPKLSIFAYTELLKQLRLEKKSAMVYNFKQLRRNHGLPLDMDHPRWKNLVMSPSFEDDTDPLYQGYK